MKLEIEAIEAKRQATCPTCGEGLYLSVQLIADPGPHNWLWRHNPMKPTSKCPVEGRKAWSGD